MAILSKMKSTLGKLSSAAAPMASKLSVAGKPALLVAKTAAMSNPYTAGALIGGTLLVGGLSLNKKNTLGSIQNKVEDTASGGINMVKKGASSVSSGLSNMMMPFIVLSGLGVLFMFLKK